MASPSGRHNCPLGQIEPGLSGAAGGRARTVKAMIDAMAAAKAAGLTGGDVKTALTLIDWGDDAA